MTTNQLMDFFRYLRRNGMCIAMVPSYSEMTGQNRVEHCVFELIESEVFEDGAGTYPDGSDVNLVKVLRDHVIDVRGCQTTQDFIDAFSPFNEQHGVRSEFDACPENVTKRMEA